MTRGNYNPDSKFYEDYYVNQAGFGLPVFIGGKSYRGRGLGNLLGGIGRTLLPLLKKGGRALLKEGTKTGLQIAQDVLSGREVKSSIKKRARLAGKRMLDSAVSSVVGRAAPPGTPIQKRIKLSTRRGNGQSLKRRRRLKDVFD